MITFSAFVYTDERLSRSVFLSHLIGNTASEKIRSMANNLPAKGINSFTLNKGQKEVLLASDEENGLLAIKITVTSVECNHSVYSALDYVNTVMKDLIRD